jgi:hypothetical protein
VQRDIANLLEVPAIVAWFQSSPVPRWVLLGVVVVGVGTTLGRRGASGTSSASGAIGLLLWLGLLLGGAYWLWLRIR